MYKNIQTYALAIVLGAVFMLAGCNRKVAKTVPPPTPPPAGPTATFAANPNIIQQGQSVELTWTTTNADSVSIAGLGTVPAVGSRSVTPTTSTTYTLTAVGPGGSRQAAARVTVNQPVANATSADGSQEADWFEKNINDVFFDYDKADLRADQVARVQHDATFLAQHPDIKVLIEGHCDDRGSEEYNLALGDSRANQLKNSLLAQGVSGDRIKAISYGKEHPFCSQESEQCWQENRRDHLSPQQ